MLARARLVAFSVASFMVAGCNALWGLDQLSYERHATVTGGSGGAAGSGTTSGGGPSGGTGGAGGVGGAAGGGGAAGAFCDEAALIACYPFEATADDESSGQHHANATSVTYVPGMVGQAISLQASSSVSVGQDDGSFAVAALTIEAWVRPALIPPAGARMGIFDYGWHYGLFVYEQGVRCSGGASGVEVYSPPIEEDRWTHVACTDDGNTIAVYLDGQPVASDQSIPMNTEPTADELIIGANSPSGDPFIGELDQLRLFSSVRTPNQICEAALQPSCGD